MPGFLWLLPGVVLPLVTLGVELTTRMNSETFFDPLPTPFHALLVALVPAANLAAWWAARCDKPRHLGTIELANGMAIGVALFYTILFLPLVAIALVAIAFFGLGILPLTPLIALVAAIRLRFALRPLAPAAGRPGHLLRGIALGVAVLIALEIPAAATRIGLQMARAEDAATRARGIGLIRYAGSEELLLRLCYVRSGLATDIVGFVVNVARPVEPEEARKIYYRVTGTPFNSVPPPAVARPARGLFARPGEPDLEQGGAGVAGRVEGLSLAASRIDGSVDADAALGYLEWTMVFRNASRWNREARAQIALPRGGVVSRLTLWIDGEEREAAFAGRAKVRQAYERVVRQQRDPVVVTTSGVDRVLMQLFPVPPGGEMKVRVGVTLPLALRSPGEAALRLPYLHERNFDIAPELRHAMWIESKSGSIRKELGDALLAAPASTVVIRRAQKEAAWSPDSRSSGYLVRQRLVEQAPAIPRRLVVVVDGSAAMRQAAARVAQALELVPAELELELLIAADGAGETPDEIRGPAVAPRLRALRYIGGHDNTAALARALDRVADEKSALLWITGPQPVLLGTLEPLLQRLERSAARPAWYVLQVVPGPNVLLEKLDGKAPVVALHGDDLEALISGWRAGATQLVAQRNRVQAAGAGTPRAADKTSEHLVRLWAYDEILRLAALPGAHSRETAVKLAQQYQLVTPVSGAVVLETRRQYDEAGLEPAAPGSVPSIPEPEVWMLLAAVLLVLLYSSSVRRRSFPIAA